MRISAHSLAQTADLPRRQLSDSAPGSGQRLKDWVGPGLAVVASVAPVAIASAETLAEGPRAPISLDELGETRLLGGKNEAGRLVPTYEAPESHRARIAVHGVNGSPLDVSPLTALGPVLGENTHAFAYDDRFRRLEHSALDLAQAILEWRTQHHGERLTIDAHSMGGRVTLAALAKVASITDPGPIQLNLISVPLAGYESANWSKLTPGFLRDLIPVARPSLDMGTKSRFQEGIDRLVLPESVRTTIYVAGKDEVVSGADAYPTHVVRNLRAKVVHLPEEDHVSVVSRVASLLASPAE